MTPVDRPWLLPDWAPNLHPLVVHFPIALLVTAVLVDVLAFAWRRWPWLDHAAVGLYTLGSVSALVAYVTGRSAAATVFTPGMAHALIAEHWTWGWWTAVYFSGLTSLRLLARRRVATDPPTLWILFLVGGVLGVALVAGTADRGARLVYEHGVGIIGEP